MRRLMITLSLLLVGASSAHAELVNADFTAGLSNWTKWKQVGSAGDGFVTPGGTSPLSGLTVPTSVDGSAFFSDGLGPFAVAISRPITAGLGTTSLVVDWYNQSSAWTSFDLVWDYSSGNRQQTEIAILPITATTAFDPNSVVSVLSGTILGPQLQDWWHLEVDLTPYLVPGQDYLLVARQIANQGTNVTGLDKLDIVTTVPETSTLALASIGGIVLLAFRKKFCKN